MRTTTILGLVTTTYIGANLLHLAFFHAVMWGLAAVAVVGLFLALALGPTASSSAWSYLFLCNLLGLFYPLLSLLPLPPATHSHILTAVAVVYAASSCAWGIRIFLRGLTPAHKIAAAVLFILLILAAIELLSRYQALRA